MEENKTKNIVVETYADTMAKVLEDDKSGLVKKIIHGEEEHEKEKKNLSPESIKNRFFVLGGFICMIAGILILFFFFSQTKVPPVEIPKQFVPLIFNDSSKTVEVAGLNKEQIIQTVRNAISETDVKEGGVAGIYLLNNKRSIGLREFTGLVEGKFNAGDNTYLIRNEFLMGAVQDGEKDFFILLKTRSMADIFPAMRAWESKMWEDLHGFFGIDLAGDTKYLLTKEFEDGIVENKNARILYDKNQETVLMYVFADDNSVIVTDSFSAAREIIARLAASKIKK